MQMIWAGVATLVAILAIRAHYLGEAQRWQVYLFKPLATLLILCVVLAGSQPLPHPYVRLLAAGMLLSTAGDVFQLKVTLLDTKPPIWRRFGCKRT